MEVRKGCPEEEIPGSRDARRWSDSPKTPGMLCLIPPEDSGPDFKVLFLSQNQRKFRCQECILSFPNFPNPGYCSSAPSLLRRQVPAVPWGERWAASGTPSLGLGL